jgi:hypothetical protein
MFWNDPVAVTTSVIVFVLLGTSRAMIWHRQIRAVERVPARDRLPVVGDVDHRAVALAADDLVVRVRVEGARLLVDGHRAEVPEGEDLPVAGDRVAVEARLEGAG